MLDYCIILEAHFSLQIVPDEKTKSHIHVFRCKDSKPIVKSKVTLDLKSTDNGLTVEELKILQTIIQLKSPKVMTLSENNVLFSKLSALCSYDLHIKNDLKIITRAIFTPPYKSSLRQSNKTLGHLMDILIFLFADKKSLSIDIIRVLKDAFTIMSSPKELKVTHIEDETYHQVNLIELREKMASQKKETYWGESRDIKATDIVTVIHYGGHQSIRSFIYRGKPGYRLTSDTGLGLQVTPIQGQLTYKELFQNYPIAWKYRGRDMNSITAYDDQALLFAYIEAKHLLPAYNDNEAGLRPESVVYLKGIKIEKLSTTNKNVNYRWMYMGDSKTSLFAPYSGKSTKLLSARCQSSAERVEKYFMQALDL